MNWLDWNPCVAPEETTFLSRHEDLLVLNSDDDRVLSWLDRLVTLWFRLTGRVRTSILTSDLFSLIKYSHIYRTCKIID